MRCARSSEARKNDDLNVDGSYASPMNVFATLQRSYLINSIFKLHDKWFRSGMFFHCDASLFIYISRIERKRREHSAVLYFYSIHDTRYEIVRYACLELGISMRAMDGRKLEVVTVNGWKQSILSLNICKHKVENNKFSRYSNVFV